MPTQFSWLEPVLSFALSHAPALSALAGVFVGVLVALLYARRLRTRHGTAQFEAGLLHGEQAHRAELEQLQREFDAARDKLRDSERDLAVNHAELNSKSKLINDLQSSIKEITESLARVGSQRAAAEARLEEASRGFAEREKLLAETGAALKKEFEVLANRVLEQQGQRHQAGLATVLTPFKEQIVDFRKRVDEVYHSDTRERASLLSEIKNLQQASERINEEAENLTKALKGDKRLQGNWGEMVLERVLEASGLRRDHEYFPQSAQRNAEGDLKRPDVLIRLPENKDVVIDSKVSLNAYEEALASEDEGDRERLLRQHLANLKTHVKKLSEQNYDQLPDVRSLDFVLLFVPIESAFTLAMEADPRLFTDAFNARIVIVSPTTLMMTLRIINNVWRYEKQNRNAQEISRRAGALYDKLRVLVEEMDMLGKQLGTAGKTYESLYGKLATGKGNLVRQVEHFRELGATVKKPMAPKLVEKASEED